MSTPGRFLVDGDCLRKWRELEEKLASKQLAGLFLGWMPTDFGKDGCARVLYVGKASSGRFDEHNAHELYFDGKRSFWKFASEIARAVGSETRRCIAWSNISKLSLAQIKADPVLVDDIALMVRTLKLEITRVRPDIVVFVSGHFNDEVVRRVSSGRTDFDWNRSENEDREIDDVWWRHDGKRFYLWMRHPQGAGARRAFASSKIATLLTR